MSDHVDDPADPYAELPRQQETPRVLRLNDAGDDRSAWITLLTTEHYNLQTQRAATISEANGRASIFLGAVSAGLITLGFSSAGTARSAAATTFQVVVLSSLAFLGVVTFLRCLEISIDDWQFSVRITKLRGVYAELIPDLANLLVVAAGAEQATGMLTRRRQPFQMMLSVAGTIGVIASIVIGADIGALVNGLNAPLGASIAAGVASGLLSVIVSIRFQRARWHGATATSGQFALG